jgi:hypothetical protein
MAILFKSLFSKFGKKGEKGKNFGKSVMDSLQNNFPHVQPKRWCDYDRIRKDGKMLTRLFYDSVNYFRGAPGDESEEKHYESKDDYLRKEKLSPLKLKKQLKRMTAYSFVCYGLSIAIFLYMLYILIHVSILDGIICSFFALFVLAKGLQFSLFVRQVKTGNFKTKLKDLFSKQRN